MISELIGQQLAAFNMPSRGDILDVRDRLGEVEDGLAGLPAEIAQLRRALASKTMVDATAERPAVKRTRKPPSASEVTPPGGSQKH
jgi:hypothetical protein